MVRTVTLTRAAKAQSAARTDPQIEQDVIRELHWDQRVDQARIEVQVQKGAVLLKGAVSTYTQKVAAQDAAHRVSGVLDVVNDIKVQVDSAMERSDIEIAQAVRHALDWDVRVPSSQIRSTVADGWVTLDGDVGAWYERDAAEHAVRHLAGVRGVINAIDVDLPYVKTETIRDEIEQALERRAIREARHIEIDVRNGVVTLTGPIQSWAEREAVIGAARYTKGVRDVQDQLHFGPADNHPTARKRTEGAV
jgi:osmotically-inducible protein OsmY